VCTVLYQRGEEGEKNCAFGDKKAMLRKDTIWEDRTCWGGGRAGRGGKYCREGQENNLQNSKKAGGGKNLNEEYRFSIHKWGSFGLAGG